MDFFSLADNTNASSKNNKVIFFMCDRQFGMTERLKD